MSRNASSTPSAARTRSLYDLPEEVRSRLADQLPGDVEANVPFGDTIADIVVRKPNRILVVEFKTGNPELPLPNSTIPQMRRFVDAVVAKTPELEIVPVVVTNYQVSKADKQVLDDAGVKVHNFDPAINVDEIVAKVLRDLNESNPAPEHNSSAA